MKTTLISLPCSLLVAIFVVRVTLETLAIPMTLEVLTAAVLFCTLLMFRRTLPELGVIAALTGLAELNVAGSTLFSVSPDMMLALLLAIILSPTAIRLMGMEVEVGRSH